MDLNQIRLHGPKTQRQQIDCSRRDTLAPTQRSNDPSSVVPSMPRDRAITHHGPFVFVTKALIKWIHQRFSCESSHQHTVIVCTRFHYHLNIQEGRKTFFYRVLSELHSSSLLLWGRMPCQKMRYNLLPFLRPIFQRHISIDNIFYPMYFQESGAMCLIKSPRRHLVQSSSISANYCKLTDYVKIKIWSRAKLFEITFTSWALAPICSDLSWAIVVAVQRPSRRWWRWW